MLFIRHQLQANRLLCNGMYGRFISMSEGKSKATNCVLYGCLSMVVLAIVISLVTFFGVRYGYKKLVNTYTSPAAAQLPAVTYTDAEVQTLTNRLAMFEMAANTLTNEATLTLSDRDINVLIHSQEDLKNMRDKFHFEIQNDTIMSDISVPLDSFGLDSLKGRYLNGTAGLKVEVNNGKLVVRLDSLKVNGSPVSGAFIAQLKQENLAKDVQFGPEQEKVLKRIEKLGIENGQIILKLKPVPQGQQGTPATTNASPAGVI